MRLIFITKTPFGSARVVFQDGRRRLMSSGVIASGGCLADGQRLIDHDKGGHGFRAVAAWQPRLVSSSSSSLGLHLDLNVAPA